MPDIGFQEWLRKVGFEDNPFSELEAASDPRLHECFVEPDCFYDVLGKASSPKTVILFAPRGGGKTANRIMVRHFCRKGLEVGGRIFDISYDRECLSRVYATYGRKAKSWYHVDAILGCGAIGLLEYMVYNPEQYQKGRLKGQQFFRSIVHHYLDDDAIDRALDKLNLFSATTDAKRLRMASVDTNLAEELMKSSSLWAKPVLKLLLSLLVPPDSDLVIDDRTYRQALIDFCNFAQQVGIDAIYVLVDGIDEFSPFDKDFSAAALFLKPVMEDLALMELPKVAFKFFLPLEMKHDIVDKQYVRSDRVRCREVIWTQGKLLEMLHRRLSVFSRGGVTTLAAITENGFRGSVDDELVRCAGSLPRDVIRLGALFFEVHATEVAGEDILLTEKAFREAVRQFRAPEEAPIWTTRFARKPL